MDDTTRDPLPAEARILELEARLQRVTTAAFALRERHARLLAERASEAAEAPRSESEQELAARALALAERLARKERELLGAQEGAEELRREAETERTALTTLRREAEAARAKAEAADTRATELAARLRVAETQAKDLGARLLEEESLRAHVTTELERERRAGAAAKEEQRRLLVELESLAERLDLREREETELRRAAALLGDEQRARVLAEERAERAELAAERTRAENGRLLLERDELRARIESMSAATPGEQLMLHRLDEVLRERAELQAALKESERRLEAARVSADYLAQSRGREQALRRALGERDAAFAALAKELGRSMENTAKAQARVDVAHEIQ